VSILHYENWDSATPPAAPSGWTFQSGSGLITTTSGPTPISSPNMIELPATLGNTYSAIWNTADGVGGNVTVQGTGQFTGGLNTCGFGVFARASSNTNPLGGTCYLAQINGDSPGADLVLSKYISGAPTALSSVIGFSFSLNLWYEIIFTLNAGLLTVSVIRLSDGYSLNSSGSFQSASVAAIGISNGAVTGSGYAGWTAINNTNAVWGDDWTLTSLSAPTIPPNKPVIVAFPFQCYPAWAE
jgi:hypothetical protein